MNSRGFSAGGGRSERGRGNRGGFGGGRVLNARGREGQNRDRNIGDLLYEARFGRNKERNIGDSDGARNRERSGENKERNIEDSDGARNRERRGENKERNIGDTDGERNRERSGEKKERNTGDLNKERSAERGKDGFRGRGRGSRQNQRDYTPKEMSYGRLKQWAEIEDAGELVLFMSSERKQIEIFLNQSSIKPEWMAFFVKSVAHAITAQHQRESIKQLLLCLCSTRFFENFSAYVTENCLGYSWANAEDFFISSVRILKEILNKLPEFAIKCVSCTTNLLNAVPFAASVQNNKILQDSITDLSKRAKDVFLKEKGKRHKNSKFTGIEDTEQPPDNFENLSVVPTEADLHEDAKPFVRIAKKEGGYEDVHHYLDVQFRLMRQDFILPLKEGIAEFKKNGNKKNFVCSDLRLYYDVHIVATVFKDGIDHILQFDVSKLKNVKWELSKRLIFGSLLCLSKDNFKTVLFATVSHRDANDLAKGTVSINFKTGLDDVFKYTYKDVYIMAETTAYYESYCHVLEGLKEMSKVLPLQDYIVKCKKELRPPQYLLPSGGVHVLPMYDLSPLMKNQDETKDEVAVLTTTKWPKAEVMCLNESQREAAKMALTKELAIIQGPPGTGKTYVGLKVMQVLLQNMDVISGAENKKDPILVVCYTNHALDQFLEGVLEFCPQGIVRVGGKNSSEKLQQFNLKNLKEKVRIENLFSSESVRSSNYECKRELESISAEITKLKETIETAEVDVVSERDLERFMKDDHIRSLKSDSSQSGRRKMLLKVWLNASGSSTQSVIPKMIKKHLTMLVLKWNQPTMSPTLTKDMDITQRTSYYHIYLDIYRQSLFQEMQAVATFPPYFQHNPRIQEIQHWLTYSENMILPDKELERVMPEEVMFFMSKKRVVSEAGIVENWLLGTSKGLHSQLDDVQMLTDLMSGESVATDTFDDDDASKKAQNDCIIDDDDDADSYKIRNNNAMNSMASVIHRADLLGIKETILTEEDDNNEDDRWQTVSQVKPLTFRKLLNKLKTIKPMTEEDEKDVVSVWNLKPDERFALYNLWIKRYRETLSEKIQVLVNQYKSAYARKKEISQEETLFLLRSAKVIGMTTTGAAKHRAVLQAVGCKIVVVEEAAEVLESHIVTALNRNCNHLILIGDHQQLRPSPTVYLLAKEFNLEISLFERLINNKVPHVLLKEQHRMRPEISKIMQHIYPDLEDHSSVKEYDNVLGVTKNVFFIQHAQEESHVDDSTSRANIHEAKFLVALCQYLLNQGYKESQITILATYAGQVFAIKKNMKDVKFSCHVRVTAVDNFQGEENDIILLSLVRSNSENNVGFLKVDNRVCVALSRAKKGLFVIGNFDLLASQSRLWKNIVKTAKLEHIVGTGLPVVCQNHTECQQIMMTDEDFEKCPDGGCGRPCDCRLECGHVCARKCHGYDLDHKDYDCQKPCVRKCKDGHLCQRECYQTCGDCMVPVLKQIPICGHEDMVACSVPAISAVCSNRCSSVLDCEHLCSGKCGACKKSGKHKDCDVPMTYSWPCGHTAMVPCYLKLSMYPCQKVCGAHLECGHQCIGKCGECLQGAVHVACAEWCDKSLPCGHKCGYFCSVPCQPCIQICPSGCHHYACNREKPPPLCGHACPPCKEKCEQHCSHEACDKMCSEICDVKLCSLNCNTELKCNHTCSGLCGELCVCAECHKNKINSLNNTGKTEGMIHDTGEEIGELCQEGSAATDTTSDDGQIQDTDKKTERKKRLIIRIPTCNHIFYVDELDNYVSNFDPNGSSYIFCPKCQKFILKCSRYENMNRMRSVKREEEKLTLRMEWDISKRQKTDLMISQKKLEDSPLLSGFHSIDMTQVNNQVELQAMSFKLKCAFMLSEISSLSDKTSSPSQLLMSRKDAVLKISNRVTDQQKSEFKTELLRYFWLLYLTYLDSLCSLHNISIPQQTKTMLAETLKPLNKLKPFDGVLDRAKKVSDLLHRIVKSASKEKVVKAQCLLLERSSAHAIKVMESRDEDMLCDLLGSGANSSAVSLHKTSTKPSTFSKDVLPAHCHHLNEPKSLTSCAKKLSLDDAQTFRSRTTQPKDLTSCANKFSLDDAQTFRSRTTQPKDLTSGTNKLSLDEAQTFRSRTTQPKDLTSRTNKLSLDDAQTFRSKTTQPKDLTSHAKELSLDEAQTFRSRTTQPKKDLTSHANKLSLDDAQTFRSRTTQPKKDLTSHAKKLSLDYTSNLLT